MRDVTWYYGYKVGLFYLVLGGGVGGRVVFCSVGFF